MSSRADTIEEWRELAARQLEQFTVTTQKYRAEIQRLREALERIANLDRPIRGESTPAGAQCEWLKNLAREALAGDAE